TYGVFCIVACGRHNIKGRIDRPRACKKLGMRLAGIDDALKLGVGQDAIRHDIGRQMWPVRRLRRCDRGHRGGLHEFGRMRMRVRNTDRLQRVFLIKRVGESSAFRRRPLDRLVGEFDALWISKSDKLIEDAQRDWSALGMERLLVTPLSRFRQGTPIRLSEGVLFTTYG